MGWHCPPWGKVLLLLQMCKSREKSLCCGASSFIVKKWTKFFQVTKSSRLEILFFGALIQTSLFTFYESFQRVPGMRMDNPLSKSQALSPLGQTIGFHMHLFLSFFTTIWCHQRSMQLWDVGGEKRVAGVWRGTSIFRRSSNIQGICPVVVRTEEGSHSIDHLACQRVSLHNVYPNCAQIVYIKSLVLLSELPIFFLQLWNYVLHWTLWNITSISSVSDNLRPPLTNATCRPTGFLIYLPTKIDR